MGQYSQITIHSAKVSWKNWRIFILKDDKAKYVLITLGKVKFPLLPCKVVVNNYNLLHIFRDICESCVAGNYQSEKYNNVIHDIFLIKNEENFADFSVCIWGIFKISNILWTFRTAINLVPTRCDKRFCKLFGLRSV